MLQVVDQLLHLVALAVRRHAQRLLVGAALKDETKSRVERGEGAVDSPMRHALLE
jgi:hypothetical protein